MGVVSSGYRLDTETFVDEIKALTGIEATVFLGDERLSTTVAGRLGEWIELGGSGRQAVGQQSGAFSVGTGDARDNRSIWLKVEEAE